MRTRFLSALLGFTLVAPSAMAGNGDHPSFPRHFDLLGHRMQKALGYLDPKTGAFHAAPKKVDPDTLTTVSGKIVYNFIVHIRTPGMGLKRIGCAAITGASPGDTIDEPVGYVNVTSTVVTCRLVFNFQWRIDSGSSVLVAIIEVAGFNAAGDEVRGIYEEALDGATIPTGGATATHNFTVVF